MADQSWIYRWQKNWEISGRICLIEEEELEEGVESGREGTECWLGQNWDESKE